MNKAKALVIMEFSATIQLSEDIVITKYKKLAKKYHPDINKSTNAHEKFVELQDAKDFLIEDIKNPYQNRQSNNNYSNYNYRGGYDPFTADFDVFMNGQRYNYREFEEYIRRQQAQQRARYQQQRNSYYSNSNQQSPYFKFFKNKITYLSHGGIRIEIELYRMMSININGNRYDLVYQTRRPNTLIFNISYDDLKEKNFRLVIEFTSMTGGRTYKTYKIDESLINHLPKKWWDVF